MLVFSCSIIFEQAYYFINDNKKIDYNDILNADFSKVEKVEIKMDRIVIYPIAEIQDDVIKVSIDEKDTDSNLILTNSAGMLMDTQHMPKGKTNAEIDAHRLSKGVYNISLSRHGKVLNNQKFLVK